MNIAITASGPSLESPVSPVFAQTPYLLIVEVESMRCTVIAHAVASGSDEKARIITPIKFSLEEALEYINSDELVEVTPQSIRMRKIYLKEHERKRTAKNN